MTISVRNPRTGEADYSFDAASPDAVAVTAARLRAAQPGWAALGADGRASILRRFANVLAADRGAIVGALAVDTGRQTIAEMELAGVIGIIERWAARAPTILAELDVDHAQSAHPTVKISNRHIAYPLFGAIAPWNFPLLLALIDAVPALMAGCAALIKPSEVTPRFIPHLRRAIDDVPELAAVLAVIAGDADTGRALIANVDYVCFTGSVATGRKVAEAAAAAFIPANLELGGKDPMIVLPSADPEEAAAIALRASVTATGQACQSIERLYVHRSLGDRFLSALVAGAERVRFNYPDIAGGDIGPFIFPPQADKVQAQIDDAIAGGARLLTGGQVETLGGGKYLAPTVLVDVTRDMAIITEETFGPVIPVTLYDDIDEAIALANDSIYGLGAAVIGAQDQAEAVAARLEVGAVSVNDGSLTASVWDAANSSFKMSGMGPSRMGDEGLTRFLRTRAIMTQVGRAARIGG